MSSSLKLLLRKLTTLIISHSLMIWSVPAFSQNVNPNRITNSGMDQTSQYAAGINNLIQQAAGMYMNARQQSFQIANQGNVYSQYSPQTQPDKYFGCPIPQSMPPEANNACMRAITSPSELSTAMALKQIGASYDNYYRKLLNPAQNSRSRGAQFKPTNNGTPTVGPMGMT
ncbi:MAG: hypothetical protein ACPGJV_02365, partial [Bacteriovoracaceae bacterium]